MTLGIALAVAVDAGANDAHSRAREAFRSGVKAFQAEDYREAAAQFHRAYEIKPAWKLLFNIGQCEAALKNYGLALDAFEGYLAQGGDEVDRARQREVLAEVQRLREMVGYLEVEGREGDVVVVDGYERGALPLIANLRLSVGQARVEVLRGEEVVLSTVVEILGTQTTTISARQQVPIATEAAPAPAPLIIETEDAKSRTGVWVSFGAAGAAAVGAAITGGLALGARKRVDSHCEGGVCPSAYEDEEKRAMALAVTTDVLIGVAAAGAVLGLVLLMTGEEPETDTARISPVISGDAAGLVVTGRF